MSSTLLLEIGCEELPTSFLDGALEQLEKIVPEELAKQRLTHGRVRILGTPRRLAALVADVADAVAAREEELLGPPETAARAPDGKWTRAAEGFAKKNDVPLDALSIADTPRGRYLRAVKMHPGAESSALLPGVLQAVCARIAFSKSMRWADLDTPFGRPIQWIVALYGRAVVPFTFAGVTAGDASRGHRFLAPDSVRIPEADEYVTTMGLAHVRIDPDARRVAMLAGLESAAAIERGELVRDAFLEKEVLGLVEEPHVITGRFEESFLRLPDALIESVMRGHQRYFAVRGKTSELDGTSSGRLLPLFLTVVNTASDPDTIRRGNERVMRARLSDAAFFVEQDHKTRLDARVEALNGVAFHAKLGSYGDKARRLAPVAAWIAERFGADAGLAARAATLAKADLVTLTVGEFPELQGIIGAFYARHDGEDAAVADAIAAHYQPRGAADDVAATKLGASVALADRADTLLGCLAVGLRPTGSEDPFGLRRVTIGMLRTLLHHRAHVSLAALSGATWDVYVRENGRMLAAATAAKVGRDEAVTAVTEFCAERLRVLLEERFPKAVVSACMAARKDDPTDVLERVEALAAFWETPAAADLAVAFRRVFNISAKDAPAGELTAADRAVLVHPSETALIAAFESTRAELAPLLASREYTRALELIARSLRAPVDRLFDPKDGVFVMDKDDTLRNARLRLLGRIADAVGAFARFDALD